ncbi:thiaminase/transcriptional activator TenA [Kribbella aluminosa]|uniref:Aminopyrimidine aminohydrolase n=1 Tax=Kribbella aluminosa TaxID=416017 RepID=A0ABS4UX46_9ACTN|nr:thiaminase II [Kribbella aluminosa]MBP2356232.1 thiaminase/transcriptional activator TenA [Kribbella aluminosa]
MTFSSELWDRGAASVYDQIVRHPFITGLTEGTLGHDAFRYFITQDSHYLRAYSRALSLVAARAPDEDAVSMFALHAANAIAVERELHTSLLESLGLTAADVDAAGSGPTTTAYMSYLTAVCATGTYAEAVAAVLPCYWIYRGVGRELLKQSSPDPLYAKWIATYGSEEFDVVVEQVLAVTDTLDVGTAERERCHQHFATTCRYEWMFWDAAYHTLDWPVG